ncbi:hypothetical protein RHSIM_Rhsim08G0149000 [Rhododendron simsii]|uniref:Transmembrane protein n=1 Tax=Rhododendron simsii TaxID=118357 RepID=A0A834GJT2_RHOSS|nr:hypothetical protein RHSIM_Rhsim08G0149000 [Rhododendron simsii]
METPPPPPPYMPDQQQIEEAQLPYPVAASANSTPRYTSGSIGPFFAVIFVLAILAILSCVFESIFVGQDNTPSESINHGSCFRWLKGRRWRRHIGGDCVGVGAKVTVGEKGDNDG